MTVELLAILTIVSMFIGAIFELVKPSADREPTDQRLTALEGDMGQMFSRMERLEDRFNGVYDGGPPRDEKEKD